MLHDCLLNEQGVILLIYFLLAFTEHLLKHLSLLLCSFNNISLSTNHVLDTVLGTRDINKEVKSLETYIYREDRQKTNIKCTRE